MNLVISSLVDFFRKKFEHKTICSTFSFSDAEVLEDIVESVLTGDASTEDAVERIDDGVEVFGNEVATEV